MKYRLKIFGIKDIMKFVEAAAELEEPCEVVSGRYRVNAKSLMAVLAIPETGEMTLELRQGGRELPEKLRKYLW